MPHAHLIVHRVSDSNYEILLGQKNFYLPPHGKYQWAAIAHHAVQYVIPGGRMEEDEEPEAAAVRELYEDTGVQIHPLSLRRLCTVDDRIFYVVRDPGGLELGAINKGLSSGSARSLKHTNMAWVSIDSAKSWLGMKTEYQHLDWVTKQVMRALEAGFGKEHLGQRANESHAPFIEALTQLRAGL